MVLKIFKYYFRLRILTPIAIGAIGVRIDSMTRKTSASKLILTNTTDYNYQNIGPVHFSSG